MAKKPRKPPATAVPAPQRRHSLAAPTRGKGPARTFTSRPVPVEFAAPEHRFVRADIEISGIFHGEASYEGRIFLNNPKADERRRIWRTGMLDRSTSSGMAGAWAMLGIAR
jgi:hypothetical protein